MDHCDPGTLLDKQPEVCLRQAKKCPNNCFKRFCWTVPYLTSIRLCQIFLHPKDTSGIQHKCKKCKNEDFLDWQYKSYSNEFLSFMLFSYLLHYVLVTCNGIGFKSCFISMYGTVFAFLH